MPVVVVESPAKAKTINQYLGSDYVVLASYGHVRDLPPKNGSVDPEDQWRPRSGQQRALRCRCRAARGWRRGGGTPA